MEAWTSADREAGPGVKDSIIIHDKEDREPFRWSQMCIALKLEAR